MERTDIRRDETDVGRDGATAEPPCDPRGELVPGGMMRPAGMPPDHTDAALGGLARKRGRPVSYGIIVP